MLKSIQRVGLAGIGLLAASTVGVAEGRPAECTDDAILVFDGSGSMDAISHNGLKSLRIDEARAAIEESMPQISPFRKLGLLIFGPGPAESCSNIDLRFRPQSNAGPRIIADVDALTPVGQTPLTNSVDEAVDALDLKDDPGVVVLLTALLTKLAANTYRRNRLRNWSKHCSTCCPAQWLLTMRGVNWLTPKVRPGVCCHSRRQIPSHRFRFRLAPPELN